jgi:guanylate kinase
MVERVLYSGNHYCLSKKEVDEKLSQYNKVAVVVDKNGVQMLKQMYGDMVKVIYVYCNEETLYQRMLERGDSPEQAKKRIEYLHEEGELSNINMADYVICTDKHDLEHSSKMAKYFVWNFEDDKISKNDIVEQYMCKQINKTNKE